MHARVGPKRTVVEGSAAEAEELQHLYEDLRKQLSTPRIERLGGRALACWNADEQTVQVLRKDGKFGNFGYSHEGKYFLEYYEAMFLLELGRLQLQYHSMLMSIEQAYLLLLGEAASSKYNEYLVYSHLSRMGYILVRHQNISFDQHMEVTPVECAWELALSAIKKCSIPEYIIRSPHYSKVKKNMEQIKESIMEPLDKKETNCNEEESAPINFERKLVAANKRNLPLDDTEMQPTPSKRRCLHAVQNESKSLINLLKDEPEYKKFQEQFTKFDIVPLAGDIQCDDNCRSLRINFDIYLHNDGFKKSAPKPPTMRIIVLDANVSFPTHAEIALCYRLQKWPVPLLVVSVGESKQIQAFLYFIS